MRNKEKLKEYIVKHVHQYIIQDCRSFVYVRLNQVDDYRNGKCNLGGGNILMAMGLFSALGYLGKIFWILSKDNYDINKSSDINETDAFFNLIKKTPYNIGLQKIDIKKQWNQWRDKLFHLTVAQGQIQAADAECCPTLRGQYPNYLEKLKNSENKTSFNLMPNTQLLSVNIDKLVTDVEKISLWLIDQIEQCHQEKVGKAIYWLETKLKE